MYLIIICEIFVCKKNAIASLSWTLNEIFSCCAHWVAFPGKKGHLPYLVYNL